MSLKSSRPGAVPPPWLRWFINDVTRAVIDRQILAPLGCHYFEDTAAEVWEVTLFVSRTEIVGGPQDGQRIPEHLQLDISAAMRAFDAEPQICWQVGSAATDDEIGSHLSLEGVARGRQVWLRFTQEAPAELGPGRLLHAVDGVLEDLW